MEINLIEDESHHLNGKFLRFRYCLHIEIVEAYDGIYEAVNVVGSSRRPLETDAVEHLSGEVVSGFYPACLVGATHIVGHERTNEGDEVWILHHLLQRLLELFSLHALEGDTCLSKTHQNVAEELAMGVAWMEHDALLWCLCELHDGTGHLVDRRELETLVK